MKHAQLCAIAHTAADSLACGMGFMIGVSQTDVYGEAAEPPGGAITVDFLHGAVVEGDSSLGLRRALALYRDELPAFWAKHGGSIDASGN
jgi:hypothetical protein